MTETRKFDLSGGNAALDFANTLAWRQSDERRREDLQSYADLVEWGRQSGIIDEGEAAALLAAAERHPSRAAEVLEEAKRVRESIFDAFANVAAGTPVTDEALAGLNARLPEALSRLRLEAWDEGVVWTWSPEPALERVLWPVVRRAADLLTSDRRERVRECASDTCGWLFIDESRNHSRRWCDMKVCGNRDKVRRYRGRER
jgi:predicted RNA-binding Zn ribbon-like protein